jgi:hypothetical protein
MKRSLVTAVLIVGMVGSGSAKANEPITISSFGWTITADLDRGVLSISQESLGTVLQNVHIVVESEIRDKLQNNNEHELLRPTGWSVERTGQSLLTLHSVHPIGAWIFEATPDAVKISSTFTNTVLTAEVPAPLNRIPVRSLDPQGFPVRWKGTEEAALTFGGEETSRPSFLPRKNPEVMYFGLGLVSGANFHDLFDRETDTVIQFSDQTTLRRADQDDNLVVVTMPVPGNASIQIIPDYYTKILGVPSYTPFDDTYFSSAPMVWSSWTGYYRDVTENDMVRNTDWLAKNLKPYGLEYVQLDDGYDEGKHDEHYWIENWDKSKFPHGPQWLTDYIKSKGLRAGIWLVPNAYAGSVDQHPDWYLHSKEGPIVLDYHTPALDSSNPEVLKFLGDLFTKLDDWGFDYYKFDGEGSIPLAMPELDTRRLFDPSVDPVVAYRKRLKVIRDTIGPGRFIEVCAAGMPLNGMGYFNSYFNGNDVFNNWQGMYSLFSSINGNGFFNHLVAYVTPGEGLELGKHTTLEEAKAKRVPAMLNEIATREDPVTGIGVSDAEARTLVSYVALTGVAYPVGNVMLDLPAARLKLLQQTMPTMPIVPLDLFSRGTESRDTKFLAVHPDYYIHNYPEILDLKVHEKWGAYDVAGFTNWRSEAVTRKISLVDKLGLDASSTFVLFDFWNQKLLGVFSDQMEIEIEPHDTRVLSIHPLANHPQFLGTSRHITGAYSVVDEGWDPSKSELSGTSQSVAGDSYALWFYVPRGFGLTGVSVGTMKAPIAARHSLAGNLLTVRFSGQAEPVEWKLTFDMQSVSAKP